MYRTSNFNKNSKIMHSIEKIISILIYIIIIPIIIFTEALMLLLGKIKNIRYKKVY